ncbi:MAG: 5-oxoprolinase subunit PxpA [Treponemataceae bacterium]
MINIDLNCDMGESFGEWKLGFDEEAMPFVSSVNIACGFHASDPLTIRKTVVLAKRYGVAVGAHPGFHDLVGFGRRRITATPAEIQADVIYQIGAVLGFCRAEGVPLQHVKVHGALYNMAEKDFAVASAIAEAIKAVDPKLYMLCLANSAMTEAAKQTGIPFVEEAFADRAYNADGTLVSSRLPGAVLHDAQSIAERVLTMAKKKTTIAIDGTEIPILAQTICVHGDNPDAVVMVRTIRKRLEQEGIRVAPFGLSR